MTYRVTTIGTKAKIRRVAKMPSANGRWVAPKVLKATTITTVRIVKSVPAHLVGEEFGLLTAIRAWMMSEMM